MSQKIQSFFETIARSIGVPKEDIKEILPPRVEKKREIGGISMTLKVEEDPPISISAGGPIIELQGDNQRHKTVSLLYLCNLLGYDFDDPENIEFLANPDIVLRGEEILQKLKDGKKAILKVKSREFNVSISVKSSWIDFKVVSKKPKSGESFHDKYDLKTMLPSYRKEIRRYFDLRFVSKGRDFDRQVLKNISKNLKIEVEKYRKKVEGHIEELLGPSLRLLESLSYARQDPEERLRSIEEELKGYESDLNVKKSQRDGLTGKLGLLSQLKELINENENRETFKKLKEAYELKNKIDRLKKRREVSKQVREKRAGIKRKKGELKRIEKELSSNKKALSEIDEISGKSLNVLKGKKSEFDLAEVIRTIVEKQIMILREEALQQYGGESLNVVDDIVKTAAKYDGSLKVPKWGTLQSLQETLKEVLKTVRQHIFVTSAIKPLIDSLEKYGIKTDEDYQELQSKNTELEGIVNGKREEIRLLKSELGGLKKGLSEKDLGEIEDKLKDLRSLQSDLKSQLEGLSDAEDLSIKLHGLAKGVIKEGEDPLPLVYSPDWETKLESREEEIRQEIKNFEIESLDKKIQELRRHRNGIKEAIAMPERERVEKLREFKEVLNSFISLLEGGTLLKRARSLASLSVDDEMILRHLRNYGILDELDELLNFLFLERCKWYFSMMKTKKCKCEEITKFDYLNREFELTEEGEKRIPELSGGTSSSMTVLSLASSPTNAKLGTTLLVDEFGDVGPSMRRKIYGLLAKEKQLGCAVFVRLTEGSLRAESIK